MAITTAKAANNWSAGNRKVATYDVTFDNSYPAGGYTLTNANFGLRSGAVIENVIGAGGNITTTYYDTQYNPSSNKLQVITGAAEASGDLHLLTIRCTVIAR